MQILQSIISGLQKINLQLKNVIGFLNFFYSQGIGEYGNNFTLDGKELSEAHSTGLVAMNAAACLASTYEHRKDFVDELWNTSIPIGEYRYYDSVLYMLGILQVSGNFKIYKLLENK